jgi:hypothetical protein
MICRTLFGDSRWSSWSAINRAMSAAVSLEQNKSSPARRSWLFSASSRATSFLSLATGESGAGCSALLPAVAF